MVNISKKYIPEDVLLKLFRLYFELLFSSGSLKDFNLIIGEFFSPTEKIMIAKRLGILYLLTKKVSFTEIANVLKVSTNTVAKFALLFDTRNGITVKKIKSILKKEAISNFFDDVFAAIFIQPGVKIGHHKLNWEHEKRKSRRRTI